MVEAAEAVVNREAAEAAVAADKQKKAEAEIEE